MPELEAHLVVSHAVATAVLQDSSWSSDPTRSPRLAARFGVARTMARSVLLSDPPDHARLRRSLREHLSPRAVEQLRPRVRAIVNAAWEGREPDAPLDVMAELAYPVPLAVICELLAVPPDVARLLRVETPGMVAMLDPLAPSESMESGASSAFAIMLELVPLVAERRETPGDDLLSALAQGSVGSDLEVDEAITMALLLLAAGHETTANLVGNAVIALHRYPDVAVSLRQRPDLLPRAVEELLRFESPVQLTSRIATRHQEIAGATLSAGDQVFVSLGGANRDPEEFVEPDRLDLMRGSGRHLAFGHGMHFCAGAGLARVEAQEILLRLLGAYPPIESLDLAVERGSSATFRRVNSLVLG